MAERAFDVAIVGGGLVGAALGYGLRDLGKRLAILDEGDLAYRAARGNFGLIWVQGKGLGMPAYAEWTLRSARAWPRLAAELRAMAVARITQPDRYFLLVETGDEVLDYREAVAFYAGANQFVRGGGDHTFTDFDAQLAAIVRFAGVPVG